MADIVSPNVRSRMMSGIRSGNTKPEKIVRNALHRRGFRYRLHDRHLPGKPDLVFAKYRAVIFVNGCFWHGHDCHLFKWPQTREDFWRRKITGNRERDCKTADSLRDEGWRVLLIWECALKGKTSIEISELVDQTANWLISKKQYSEICGRDFTND